MYVAGHEGMCSFTKSPVIGSYDHRFRLFRQVRPVGAAGSQSVLTSTNPAHLEELIGRRRGRIDRARLARTGWGLSRQTGVLQTREVSASSCSSSIGVSADVDVRELVTQLGLRVLGPLHGERLRRTRTLRGSGERPPRQRRQRRRIGPTCAGRRNWRVCGRRGIHRISKP